MTRIDKTRTRRARLLTLTRKRQREEKVGNYAAPWLNPQKSIDVDFRGGEYHAEALDALLRRVGW